MNSPHIDLDLVYHVDDAAYSLPPPPDPRIRQAALWIAQQFDLHRLYASIAIVDDATMQTLNAQRLGHDWPTDVISFELDYSDSMVEGEVIASVETAARVCHAAGWPVADELLLYLIHGLLHVAGMDDQDDSERLAMRELEQACLLAVGVTQAALHVQRFDTIYDSEAQQ